MKTVVFIIFALIFSIISVFCWMAINHNLKYYSSAILETFTVFSAFAAFFALKHVFTPKMLIVLKFYFTNILKFTPLPAENKFLKWLALHEKRDGFRLNYRAV